MLFVRHSLVSISGLAFWLAIAVMVCLTAQPVNAQRVPIERIPNPRYATPKGWVTDMTNTLSPEAVEYTNRVVEEINQELAREMAVVLVTTTENQNHREYATELFNYWTIGRRGVVIAPGAFRNDGVLLFVAVDDRRAEIVLGDGIDSTRYEQIAQRIIDDVVVANFKAGDANSAVYQGARACATQIFGITDLYAPPMLPSVSGLDAQPPGPARQRRGPITWWPWLAGGGLVTGFGLLIGSRYYARYRPRHCDQCQSEMVLLREDQDDSFLNPGQQLEEHLGSVDYDVWACLQCDEVKRIRYGKFFTRYRHCPECRYITVSRIEQVLVAANYQHGGKVRVLEDCQHCRYAQRYTYRTPRLVKSSSSSGSGSSGGIGGGSGSGGGGSRSGGGFRGGGGGGSSNAGGFGGGRSSGGGAGGGW